MDLFSLFLHWFCYISPAILRNWRNKIIDEVGATVVNEVVNSNTVESVRISTVQLPTGNYTLRLEMGQVFGGVYVGMFYK